jgi:acyl-CoA synthetase (AMP-forming)/AMP-acid ligase II
MESRMAGADPDLCAEIQRLNPGGGVRALLAPGREPMDYDRLLRHTGELAAFLSGQGLVRGDAVAVVLADGPEQLAVLLAVTRVAACAPLNPALTAEEFRFALADLGARAVILDPGLGSPAATAARDLGLGIIEARPEPGGPAGSLTLAGGGLPAGPPPHPPGTALLLHTSATTGVAKLVPLSHAQLLAMVEVLRASFPAAVRGRVLMLVPQYHLTCLLSILLQLLSGGACICTGGYRPERFLAWVSSFAPTQFTGTPTLHRAILTLLERNREPVHLGSLRFLSTIGAPMTRELQDELEATLGVPVVEGYGMTEAGRITMTPLDPARRRPGSVGEVFGPEVAILGEDGRISPGGPGEILLRGPMVFSGYAHNPEANRQAFLDGWFRTGDLGHLDADGFLFLTGRLKEMINRGGEKILPYEIEAVLSRHPAIREAAVFGHPHPRLGQDVACAAVLRPGAQTSATELRRFLADSLAPFKIPRRFLFLTELPKSGTGKVQRACLAGLLGLEELPEEAEDVGLDPLAVQLAGIWTRLLKVPEVAGGDDFFALGGDSLLAMTLFADLQEACGRSLDIGLLARLERFDAFLEGLRQALQE